MARFSGTPVEETATKKPRFGGKPPTATKSLSDRLSSETRAAFAEMSAMTQNPAWAEYERLPWWAKPIVATTDIVQLAGSAPMLGFGEKAMAGIRAPFTGKTYEEELAEQRQLTNAARRRSGLAGTTAQIATNVKALPQLFIKGGGNLLTRAAVGGAEGAGYGAASAGGEDTDIATGAALGLAGGAGGSAFADLVKAGGTKVSKAVQNYLAEPTAKAKEALWEAAQAAGLTADSIRDAIRRHGSDLIAADVLGKRGTSLGRAAANIAPGARETLETAVAGRKAGQSERVVATLEEAAGLPAGTRQTVEELKKAAYEKHAAAIDKAYAEARAAGYDLPRTPFEEVLNSPMGGEAYEKAARSLKNRAATEGLDAASELARLDQTKRELDNIADIAYRAGDKDRGSQAAAMAKKLRDTMDQSIAGPEYARARGLRQKAYGEEEAIQTGAELAGGRIPASLPSQARTITDADQLLGLRQGYALQQAENLLNRGSTEGALNVLSRPLQREAYEAALGENAPALAQRLETEKMFNVTNRDIVGNSTTARQLTEALGMSATGTGLEWLTGIPHLGTLGTVGGLARMGGQRVLPMIQRKLATRGQGETAEEIANLLTQSPNAIPLQRVIPPGVLEQGVEAVRDYLARVIALGTINVGTRGPQ